MRGHPLDPILLSAYHDGALGETERRAVEEHLSTCAECRQRLADYARLGGALRAIEELPVPSTLDVRVAALVRPGSAHQPGWSLPRLTVLRPARVAMIAASLVVALLAASLGIANHGSVPLVAAAYLYDDQGTPAIEVQFTRPVDQDNVGRSIRIEPPVELQVSWRGDTMIVKPSEPLQPRESYTLSLKPRGADSQATPVALQFVGHVPESPVPLATKPASTATPTMTPAFTSTPSPATPTAAPSAPATATLSGVDALTPSATPAATTATVSATATATPTAATTSTTTATPTAATGTPATPTTPTATGTSVTAGMPIATSTATAIGTAPTTGTATPSGTPSTTGTPPPSASPSPPATEVPTATARTTATAIPLATLQATPTTGTGSGVSLTPCPVPAAEVFAELLREDPATASRLDCALEPDRAVDLVVQPFERGWVLWRADRGETIVLLTDGLWLGYQSIQGEADEESPPPDRPSRLVNKLWSQQPWLRPELGPPTAAASTTRGVLQDFDRGMLLWTRETTTFVLYSTGSWEHRPHGLATPTNTPSPTRTTPTPTAMGQIPPSEAQPRTDVSPSPTRDVVGGSTADAEMALTSQDIAVAARAVRDLGSAYLENPSVATRLGTARGQGVAVSLARQPFEEGIMLWRSDTREITALRRDGTWSLHRDNWQPEEALAEAGDPPAGRLAPVRGFGKVWRENPDLRDVMGWATAVEQWLPARTQGFLRGQMIWASDRVVYVLYQGGTWQSFAEASFAPRATPIP